MIAREVCVASITASASAANSLSAYASGCPAGRSDHCRARRTESTRQCRARYGICIFQWREWMTDQVGRSKSSLAFPVPLPEDADTVPLDEALLVRVAGAGLFAASLR